jgi:hypothetical protein
VAVVCVVCSCVGVVKCQIVWLCELCDCVGVMSDVRVCGVWVCVSVWVV